MLHKRFKKLTFFVIITIIKKRYIINNVRRKREFIKYVDVIIQAAKITKIIIYVQIYFIYNDLKLKFRYNLIKLKKNITINIFLQNLKKNKKI